MDLRSCKFINTCMNNEHDDDDDEIEHPETYPIYFVDEETRSIIEATLNCLVTLADTQVLEEGSDAILAIADALADRFGIDRVEIEETVHTTDEGDEIIYKPKTGLFKDSDAEEEE
jgi:hypothetical protein